MSCSYNRCASAKEEVAGCLCQVLAPPPPSRGAAVEGPRTTANPSFPAAGWRELWCSGDLTDAALLSSDDVKFRVHRVILCAVSPFFRSLFLDAVDGEESVEHEMRLDLPADLLRAVLEYVYTGLCPVTVDNVRELLPFADKHGLTGVVQQCCLFLLRQLTPANCLGVLRSARRYFCQGMAAAGHRFVKTNFSRVAQESSELAEMAADELGQLLRDDELNVDDEATVFDVIVRWVDADPVARARHLPGLLPCVRYGLLSSKRFAETVLRCKYVLESAELQQLLEEPSIFLADMAARSSCEADLSYHLTRPRVPYEVVLTIGGWRSGSPTGLVESYDPRSKRWLLSRHAVGAVRSYHGACVLDGLVYVVGGYDGQKHFNSLHCFDPVSAQWQERACMYNERCYVAVCMLDGLIYALGGYNGRERLSSAERYNPEYNQWQMIPPMNRQRSDASAAALRGKVYIAGGFNGNEFASSAEVFDPTSMQWTLISPMNSPHSGLSIIACDSRLYAIGGFDGTSRLNLVEYISPTHQFATWREAASMLTPRSNFGCTVLNGMIYVIGGFDGIMTIPYVESFNPKDDTWTSERPMNLNRSALTACVLTGLPNARDYSYLSKTSSPGQGCSEEGSG